MQKTFSSAKIERFKREAKAIAKSDGLSHSEALEKLARREGYKDWGLLAHNAKKQGFEAPAIEVESAGVLTLEAFREGLTQFLKALSAGGVRQLCGGDASLWVRVEEVAGGKLDCRHIEVLGAASNHVYRQYARQNDLLLAINYEGMGEGFVFPEDVDDDGEPIQPDHSSVKFTTKEGRTQLLQALSANGEWEYEGLIDKFNTRFDDH